MAFLESLQMGKRAEEYAERYFEQNNLKYTDVRDDTKYRVIDIDYIVDGLGTVEVKLNWHKAKYGQPGQFIFIELECGNNSGWWYKTQADYFLFNDTVSGILIKNDDMFKSLVNNAIENGNHGYTGDNRIDIVKDKRFYNDIEIKNMRLYLFDIEAAGIEYQIITNSETLLLTK